jgi:hypothetical protein
VLIAIRTPARTAGGAGVGGVGQRLGRYGVLVFCAVTFAYAPRSPAVAWATQFSLGLAVLAALWTERGLAFLDARGVTRAAVLLDGGVLATPRGSRGARCVVLAGRARGPTGRAS